MSQWAEANRYLSQKASSEPGRWRNTRTPYLTEIMDCLSASSRVQRVAFMKGAQVGGTECGNNWIGYVIHRAPGPMLSVQPTVEAVKKASKTRIAPLIEESPALRERVQDPRARDSGNTVLSKEFSGGVLVMTGANSAVGLRSMPARYLFLDEVDAYPGDVEGEGDPIALAEARTRTFARRKVFMVSTPTIKGRSRIEREYEASDRRRYFVPCQGCGEYQTLEFQQLRWPKGRPGDAEYACVECGFLHNDSHKTAMLAAGEWRATNPGATSAGFHLSSLYSPVGWMSWVEIAQKWEQAQGSQELLKEFINTVLGETWQESGEAPDWHRLYDRREEWPANKVPADVLLLTGGCDVQKDRLEVSIWGWCRDKRSRLIAHRVLPGDTSRPEVWADLDQVLGERWRHENGAEMALARFAIDSGYATQEVYAWARKHSGAQIMVCKGVDRASVAVGVPTKVDVTGKGKTAARGMRVWKIGVSILKSQLYGWLRQDGPTDRDPLPAPGYVHLSKGADEEYCKQLVAEQLVTRADRRGFRVTEWQKLRERNEALDCRVLAHAAAVAFGLDRFTERAWDEMAEMLAPCEAPQQVAPAATPSATAASKTRKPKSNPWLGGRGEWR